MSPCIAMCVAMGHWAATENKGTPCYPLPPMSHAWLFVYALDFGPYVNWIPLRYAGAKRYTIQ